MTTGKNSAPLLPVTLLPPLAAFTARTLTTWDYVALGIYFALNLGIGWVMSRRKPSSDAFFRGNRRVPWWAAAVSWFAAGSSAISFMALPAQTYGGDWLAFGSSPAQAFAGMLAAYVFIGIMRRLDATTVFAYLERRFDRNVRKAGAAAAILLKIGGRMSVVMLLPSLALSTITGLPVRLSIVVMGVITIIYSTEGGFMAVVWTDVMQVIVTLGGMIGALAYICHAVPGGLGGIWQTGHQLHKFHAIDWSWNFHRGTFWVFVGMAWGTIFSQISDQAFMQRAFATKDVPAARRTMFYGNLLGLLGGMLFFFVGTSIFMFYHFHPDRLDPAFASGLMNDKIVPFFIVNELPHGVVGLIIAGLFAASMGTLSSTMNSTAAVVVSDFYLPARPHSSEAQRIRLSKLATVGAGVLAAAFAWYLAGLNLSNLWKAYLNLIAIIGGGFAGVFAVGLLTRRANAGGAMIGLIGSVALTWWASSRVSEFFTGFVAVTSAMILGYLASLALGRRSAKVNLAGLTLWDLPR